MAEPWPMSWSGRAAGPWLRSSKDDGAVAEVGVGEDGGFMADNDDAWAKEGDGEEGRAKAEVEAPRSWSGRMAGPWPRSRSAGPRVEV